MLRWPSNRTWSRVEQSSPSGWASSISVPCPPPASKMTVCGGNGRPCGMNVVVTPWVWPEIRLRCPGVEGSNVVP
uniref:hypothetical protein n=1 Tax=Mycobacterium sp. HUMS_1102779 TaxID=3383487 RepID=UPI00389A4667